VNSFWRLWLLPMMGLAMLPAAFFNLFAMRQTALIGCLLGIGLPFIAARIMKRARKGDAKRAAVLMGVAAGLATGLGAGAGPIIGLLFALGALLRDLEAAARRLRDDLRAEESAALDIQVKVLADRLREEGYS